MHEGSKVTMRLEKHSEDWGVDTPDGGDPFDFTERTVCEDVSKMGEKKLAKMLDEIHREIHPEDFEDGEEEGG
jgi:hypothetical protein